MFFSFFLHKSLEFFNCYFKIEHEKCLENIRYENID